MADWLLAVLVGIVQGVLEWLPVSSEGATALALTIVAHASPDAAVGYALFLHAGTAVAATAYYRDEVVAVLRRLPALRPTTAFDATTADLSFLIVATAASAVVGAVAYSLLDDLVSALAGGAFVALIGALLIGTGIVQRVAEARGGAATTRDPTAVDAVLVGGLQGLAILPGVSRSGTTVSALLLRGHDGVESLRLSFLLSIPAAFAAGALTVVTDGLGSIEPSAALLALAVSAVVGYVSVGALVSLVRRVAFWAVCVGFGALAVVGGLVLLAL